MSFIANVVLAPATRIVMFVLLVLLSASCGGGSNSSNPPPEPVQYVYQTPSAIGDGWQVGSLSEVGINQAMVETTINRILQNQIKYRYIDALLIARNGKLVFEKRFRTQFDFTDNWAGNRDVNLHVLNSVTKSYASTLVGIAIDKGYLPSVDLNVHDYYWDKQPIANWTAEKASITLDNWLTMQSGYLWDEWTIPYLDARNVHEQMINSPDPTKFLLDRPMVSVPGTTFAYSTGVSYMLGDIVRRASGQSIAAFMEQNLFQPLQIQTYDAWMTEGQIHMGAALYLSIRDMAKLGQLFLDNGVWNGQQIVSSAWVAKATEQRVTEPNIGYGYQWWMTTFTANGRAYQSYYADGFGGQYIFVLPELNAVIAFNGSAYTDEQREQRSVRQILEQDLIPAMLAAP